MKILNLDNRDYHIHSSSFSDGIDTINDIIKYAGELGMTEIAITDHSRVCMEYLTKSLNIYPSGARYSLSRWKNVFNNVNVIFGVEGDLLNENGDVCFDIQTYEPEFIILSAHIEIYKGDPNKITDATIKAIERYHKKIKFIAHPCNSANFGKYYDIERLVEAANKYNIPLEFNGKNFYGGKTNLKKLDILLKKANEVYINSDAHCLNDLKILRKEAIKYLKENKYI